MSAPAEAQARREKRAATAVALRDEGLAREEIAARMGVARSTVAGYLRDRDGKKGRAYRKRRAGVCETCGGPTSIPANTRCINCTPRPGGPPSFWSKEKIIKAIHAWVLTYGEVPRINDWGGTKATPEQRARYARLRRGRVQNARAGSIPSYTTVVSRFGSWAAGIRAAGYEPLPSGWAPRPLKNAKACDHGHPYTPETTYYYPNGRRACLVCRRVHSRRYKKRHPTPRMTREERSESARKASLARWAKTPRPSAGSTGRPATSSARN